MKMEEDGSVHSKDSELQVSQPIPKLQERERDPEGYEAANKEPGEDIVRRSPKSPVISADDKLELIQEGSSI